jgi:hypothetical protein
MTNAALSNRPHDSRSGLSVQTALKMAWLCWLVLLAVPFLLLQALIWYIHVGDVSRYHSETNGWFLAAMICLLAVVPGSLFLRGHLFRDYWMGHPVTPRRYLVATISVGVALAACGVVSLLGCLITDSFMPNLIPGLLALVMFALHWPTGRAMVRPIGKVEDPQLYEEPR